MFVDETGFEAGTLRQGDIIADIHLLGALNPGGIKFITDQSDNKTGWSVENKPEFGDAMILSHSCEIAQENGVKVTSIILAPIRDINSATEPGKRQELIDTNLIEPGATTASFLKYFYLVPNEKLTFANGAIVDFSKCFSFRKNYYEKLVEKKKLQLTNEIRIKMSLKLAAFFYRTSPVLASEVNVNS